MLKNLSAIVLALTFGLWGAIWSDSLGLHIPIIRHVIGFIYLTFIPGFLIISSFRKFKISGLELIPYSIGMSVAFIMIIGYLMDFLYPLIGVSKPISILPIMLTFSTVIIALNIVNYRIYMYSINIDLSEIKKLLLISSKPTIILIIALPILSIIGTYIFNYYHNNSMILLLLIMIALAVILFSIFDYPSELYPLAILSIAIALLFHRSLVSTYLTGWDIQYEYYYSKLVIENSYYNPHIPATLNSVLSVVLLNPIYSIVLNINGIWVYKIVYPLLFSAVPLELFCIYREHVSDKMAFLSAFFFMSFFTFFTEMLGLARQQIAMLFLVLLFSLLFKERRSEEKTLIYIIFGLCLIVSHYTISYLFLFYIILAYIYKCIHYYDTDLSMNLLFLYIIFCLGWYIYVSDSSAFGALIRFVDHIYDSFYSELFNPLTRDPTITYATGQLTTISLQRRLFTIFQYIIQIFIMVGLILHLFRRSNESNKSYIALIYISYLLLILVIIIPFASTLNMSRIFLLTLISLSTACIQGGLFVITQFMQVAKPAIKHTNKRTSYILLSSILGIYLLFSTGFIYAITNDPPSSISLDKNMDYAIFTDHEVHSCYWLSNKIEEKSNIYLDSYSYALLLGYIYPECLKLFYYSKNTGLNAEFYPGSFIYLRARNLEGKIEAIERTNGSTIVRINLNDKSVLNNFSNSSKIYNNGGSAILSNNI